MSQSSGIRAGKAYIELATNDSKLIKGLQSAQRRMAAFGSSLTKIGGGLIGAGAGLAAPLLAAASYFAASGDQLSKAADRTGATVESLSELKHAASQSAVDFETLTKSMNKQQKGLASAAGGNVAARAAYDDLGLSVEKLMQLSPDQQFEATADAISKITDPAKRTASAMSIFGKSGADLMPLMIGGAAGIEALRKEARDLGLQVSGEDAKNATILGDTWANVVDVMFAMVFKVGGALAPMLIDVTSRILTLVAMANHWIETNRQLVVWVAAIAAGLVVAGAVLVGFGATMMIAAAAIGGIISVASTMAAIFAAIISPVGLLIGLVVGLAAAFFYFTDAGSQTISWFGTEFGKLTQIVTDTVGGMYAAISAGNLALAAEIAFTGVQLAIASIMESVLSLFGSNINDMMQMLAGVLKKVGEVVSKMNVARQGAVNWLAEMIGGLVLDDQAQQILAEDNQRAMDNAQQGADSWSSWDANAAGDEWADQFNSEDLQKKLDELNKTANSELAVVEANELRLREMEKKPAFELDARSEQIQTGMAESGSTFGTFSGAMLGQNFGLGNIQQRQLTAQEDAVAELKTISKKVGLTSVLRVGA